MIISDDSKDTLARLKVIKELHKIYNTVKYVDLFNKVMADGNFKDQLALLANEPKEEWIKRYRDYLTPRPKLSLVE